MKDFRDYPSILEGLFPGHPARRLLCTDVFRDESGEVKKRVVTIKRVAQPKDYAKHLSPESHGGKGALGVIPTYPQEFGGKPRWFVQFLALDYDSASKQEVLCLVALLEQYRVYVYLDEGTTGRGVHLYVFLTELLPQHEAHRVLTTIASLSKQLKLPYPEFMPSSASEPGKGIFLPYRGAAEDGLGANPLIDPYGEQIPLQMAESDLFRTEVEDLRTFVEEFRSIGSENKATHDSSYHPFDIGTYEGAIKAWEAETARLEGVWTERRRQHLALGASAYGVSLGMSAERIREDIETLERSSYPPEVYARLGAVNRTVERHAKGERIAWRRFYALADVDPPKGNRIVSWDVLLKLQVLEDRLRSETCKGMAGFTDLDVLDALIEVGRRYGKAHAEGVEVSISTRDLALVARSGNDTIINSHKRLEKTGWAKRWNRSRGANSGSLVLLVDDKDVITHELQSEDMDLVRIPRLRWRAGKLGKSVRPILQNLQRLQPCTRADVARAMGRESRSIRNQMNRLLKQELVEYDEVSNTYSLPADFQVRLFSVLVTDGTLDTDFKHEARFKRERVVFNALLSMKKEHVS